jgi:hypothetical protein
LRRARDEWAKDIAGVTMEVVAHFKLTGYSEEQVKKIIDFAWDVFAEDCKTESHAAHLDALLEKCIEKAIERLCLSRA